MVCLFSVACLGSVLFFITMFVMEPSSDDGDDQSSKQQTPKVMYDSGHDNKVFVGEGLPQPHFTQPQTNGTTNAYYPNGNGSAHLHVNHTNEEMQPTYRVMENSRL